MSQSLPTAFVLDASIAASWFLPDERSSVSDGLFEHLPSSHIHVPWIWWFEIHNIFVINERRERFSSLETQQALQALLSLTIIIDDAPNAPTILALARNYNLTVYVAAYLELAVRKSAPLATLDRALVHAAGQENVAILI